MSARVSAWVSECFVVRFGVRVRVRVCARCWFRVRVSARVSAWVSECCVVRFRVRVRCGG